jgi:hypothetical protein
LDQAEAHEIARLSLAPAGTVEEAAQHDHNASAALIVAIREIARAYGFDGIEARDANGRPIGHVVGIEDPGDGPYLRTDTGETVWWPEIFGFYRGRYIALPGSNETGLFATTEALRSRVLQGAGL